MNSKNEFIKAFQENVSRPGAEELLKYLESSSFFTDPASANHHLCVEGGLCEHSVHVYKRLSELIEQRRNEYLTKHSRLPEALSKAFSNESVAIVSLLHDLCKAGTYKSEIKNRKTYDPATVMKADPYWVKCDAGGDYIWESFPGYRWDDQFPYGHGEKSVYLIQKHMALTDEEAFAIRFHMSSWQENDSKASISKVYETNALAFLLHIADEFATFIDETEKVN